jgi:hypothetical protein
MAKTMLNAFSRKEPERCRRQAAEGCKKAVMKSSTPSVAGFVDPQFGAAIGSIWHS